MTEPLHHAADPAARACVLLVDDDPHNLFALEQTLATLEVEVVTAASGGEALRLILRREFALILLDVRLPDLDGYEVAAMVRRRERNRHVPIIFLSGVNRDDIHLFRGYSAGAVDYILKPVDPVVLRSKVAVFVDLFNKSRELQLQVALKQRLLDDNLRITGERALAEQALQRSERRLSAIVQALPIAIYSVDLASGLAGPRFLGDTIERISGFPAQRFVDDPALWTERIHPHDRERALAEKAAALTGSIFSMEYRWQCPDGSERVILDQGAVLRTAGDGPQEVVGTWLDVTDRRLAEQHLAQAQKIDALGQLTGGIAHDFNNMLMVIINNLERVQEGLAGEARLAARVGFARQAALRCSDLTRQLLAFARRQTLEATPLDLNALVRGMMQMLRRTLEDEIDIAVEAADGLWTVAADRAQVESALLNLVVNARDAMPAGGRIRIETANLTVAADDPAGPAAFPGAAPGEYVTLGVVDSGTGMPPDVRERAFEPFFTTKPIGRGTGLGLSIIHGFVKQSGGAIRIDSAEGQGTAVRIALPRARSAAAPAVAADTACPTARPGETVLLVEDDAAVQRVTVEELRALGYAVIEARDGASALERLAAEPGPDVLFTDIAMPGGMNGYELAAAAVALRPHLRVLYASAYPEFALARDRAAAVKAPVLQKPYFRHELAAALRALLDREEAGTALVASNQA